ncbi:mycobactin polyketide synthase MbtD [Mycobacterium sp. GA-2829]|uniref:mycobactin polyketide synthase MbtD n=1 Tax=Mycobacterium sp. GA-2829 TaxID=1772283 RepID=UPI0007402D16|nr:mycobactin polyketide synthase MbtD [Mycobacterium sp. GA-2829]KUI38326.1 polyketide synthase [Mycobacterium sp. GA-2829]
MSRPDHWPDGRVPVLLSAHAGDLIATDARALLEYTDRHPEVAVRDLAAHLAATRRVRRHRTVIRAGDPDELTTGLRAVVDGAEHPLVTHSTDGSAARVAFVFPGQGSQWPSMGADAYRHLPQYRAAVDECADAFTAAGAPSPVRYLTTADGPFTETEVEAAQFTHAVALAHVWRSHGVLPDLTVGHSLGEIGAAYIAGAITLADAAAVVIARAAVVDRLPGDHAVAVLGVNPDAAQQVIAATPGWLELAVVNATASVAVAGERGAVAAAVAHVRAQGRFAREITVGFPVHTSVLEPLRGDLLRMLPDAVFADTPVQFIGGATGDVVPAGTRFGDYWYANLRTMVRFDQAFTSALRCGARVFVELSAHPQLLFAMGDLLGDATATLVGSGRRDAPITEALSANLAIAAVAQPGYGWRDTLGPSTVRLRGVPNAPMRATAMWAQPDPLPAVAGLTVAQEVWQAADPSGPAGTEPVAVAVMDLGPGGALGAQVRAAVNAHPGAVLTDPHDAQTLVVVASQPDAAETEDAVAALTDLVGAGALRYPAAAGPRCRDVWLVTAGAEQVQPGEPVALCAGAIAAMHRSLGLEHPDLGFHHLDLAPDTTPDATVVDALLTGSGEIAVRDAVRYRRAMADAPHAPGWPLDDGVLDDVVITGGAGEIALHYARHLAERGARRIVLLSRRPVDPAVLAELAAPHGAEVLSIPCDLTHRESVSAAAEAMSEASLLVHTAGAAVFAAGDRLDAAAAAATFGAKITGLDNMLRAWPLRRDARIVLCSSVSGLWGGRGHAVYSAANRMLDAMAVRLRADGRRCVALRWGLWQSGGAAGIVDAAETARIERSGLRPMTPRAAVDASLCDHGVDPLVFSADTDRLQMLVGNAEPRPAQSVSETEAPVDTADAVRAQLAAVLELGDPGSVDLTASLFDLGVDSLLALDLRKRFRRVIGRTVPLATLLSGVTGVELVAELDEKVDIPSD